MKSDPELFEQTLKVGTEAEDYVYQWLIKNYNYVQDTRFQTRKKGTGPRLVGTENSVILPDFIIYDKFKGNWALDVKAKTAAYLIDGGRYFTADDYKIEHYMKAVQLLRLDGLYIVFKFENSLYFYTYEDIARKHVFNNSSGKMAYLFEYDKKKIRV